MFIIRSYNDDNLRANSSIELVAVSLAASLFSISNKFTWMDKEGVEDKAKEPRFKAHCPCVNGWYVLRIIWRFGFVTTRFCILSLVWSVLGGAFLGVFLGISFCIWGCQMVIEAGPDLYSCQDFARQVVGFVIYGFTSLISSPASDTISAACTHGWETLLSLIVITIFAYNKFECGICANSDDRQANNNPYIKIFIFSGRITMVIDFVIYGILLRASVFKEYAPGIVLEQIFNFMEEIEMA